MRKNLAPTVIIMVAMAVFLGGCATKKVETPLVLSPEDIATVEKFELATTPKTFTPFNILWGVSASALPQATFHKPRCVDRNGLITNTNQFKEIVKSDAQPMTGGYWINLAGASENVWGKQIPEYATKFGIDLIVDRMPFVQYLKTLEPFKNKSERLLIKMFDITDQVKEYFSAENVEKRNKEKEMERELEKHNRLEEWRQKALPYYPAQ